MVVNHLLVSDRYEYEIHEIDFNESSFKHI